MRVLLLSACWILVHAVAAQRPVGVPVRDLTLLPTLRHVPVERMAIPTPWSYQRLAVFCKLDVQLERRMRVPVLFRLGDVQRVEAMEGKGPLREVDPR